MVDCSSVTALLILGNFDRIANLRFYFQLWKEGKGVHEVLISIKEQLSTEYRETRQYSEPVRTRNKHMWLTRSAGSVR